MTPRLQLAAAGLCLMPASLAADTFGSEIRPILERHCQACHGEGSDNRIRFLEATSAADVAGSRGLWRNVAMQLRNRTMPPAGPQPSEGDRLRVSSWIDETLRSTACDVGVHAAPVVPRRLNRSEYENTVRDLFGVRIDVAELFPVDGSGGEGFDNNGETLFFSPLLLERSLEVAELVLDHVVVTPPLGRAFVARDLLPDREVDEHDAVEMRPGDSVAAEVSFYEDGEYTVSAWIRSPPPDSTIVADVLLDGAVAGQLEFTWSAAQATRRSATIPVSSGSHSVSLALGAKGLPVRLVSVDISQQATEPDPATLAAHYRLFGSEPGQAVLGPRPSAARLLREFMARAFRRPLAEGEEEPYLELFDSVIRRGDPYEAGVRVALKAILVSADFLYRLESVPERPGMHPLTNHELATRLSYFLWGSMPDGRLRHLADEGRLTNDEVLAAQVDRLLDHPRSRHFARTFIGQWLGTKDVGGRVAPTLNEIQHFYTPRIAADMREEPVLLFQRMLDEDRSVLEFVSADYTFLTERLARHYGMPAAVKGNDFQLVETPGGRRGGLLGLGAVHAMNAAYKRSSPVLRGVWTLETLFGTRLPVPPEGTPALESEDREERKLTVREMMAEHREDPTCAACHDVIDPVGLAFENYDWLGRWRDVDDDGRSLDSSGTLPTGAAFDGPAELRALLLERRAELVRQVVRKLLGYGLGRSLADSDECVIEQIAGRIEQSGFGARTLVREIVLSAPFRFVEAASAEGPGPDAGTLARASR